MVAGGRFRHLNPAALCVMVTAASLVGGVAGTDHAAASASSPTYGFTDVGSNVSPCGINDADYITLNSTQSATLSAYVWHNGSSQQLTPLAGGTGADACGINNAGQIVGRVTGLNGIGEAALWNAASPGTPQDIGQGVAYNGVGINSVGDVVMTGETAAAEEVGYEVSSGSSTPVDIGTAYGAFTSNINNPNRSLPYAIADNSTILALLQMSNGTTSANGIYLLPSPGATGTQDPFDAHVMSGNGNFLLGNDNGQAAEYSPGGAPTFFPAGFTPSAVNNSGTVAGTDAAGSVAVDQNGTVTDLGASIPAGYTNVGARAINNNGDIVGVGTLNGVTHGFLLKATAEQLSISSLTLDPPHPTVNDPSITATLTVRNDYGDAVTAVAPTLTSSDPNSLKITGGPDPASVASLDAGDSTSFTYTLTPLQPVTVSLQPAASATDPDGDPTTAPVVPALVVDLSAGDVSVVVSADPSGPKVGNATTVTATLTNKTTSTLTSLTPSLTSDPAAGLTVGSPSPVSVASLAPHATTTVTWPVTPTAAGTYTLRAAVELTDPTSGDDETDVGTGSLPVGDNTITVNETDDSAEPDQSLTDQVCDVDLNTAGDQCTLRAAITLVDTLDNPQPIKFDIPGGGVPDIAPTRKLPAMTTSTTIDGTTQPGGWVQLSGANDPSDDGLTVAGGGPTIRGLVIDGWTHGAGINVTGGDGTTIVGDRIGTDVLGTSAVPNQNGVNAGGTATTVGGSGGTSAGGCTGDCDLISGNRGSGVVPSATVSLRVQGDYIGTDVTGESAIGNTYGISNSDSNLAGRNPASVTVGGRSNSPGVAPGNVISGNTDGGLVLAKIASINVVGNLIGLDAAGAISLQPALSAQKGAFHTGVYVGLDDSVTIGGLLRSDGNVISGYRTGVADQSDLLGGEPDTVVENDRVGTDVSGTSAIPNGVGIENADLVADSQVSGNTVGISGAGQLVGSLIGTTADGMSALPNHGGVAAAALVGGQRPPGSTSCTNPCNVISGNLTYGILRAGTVQGNFIGTNIAGNAALPNDSQAGGAAGSGAASSTGLLGGPSHAASTGVCDLACNLISGNGGAGVESSSAEAGVNDVQGNLIGVGVTGSALPNHGPGVEATNNPLVGGEGDQGNRIEDNLGPGVLDEGGGAATVEGNVMLGNAGGIVHDVATGRITRPPADVSAVRSGGTVTVTGNLTDLVTSLDQTSARVDVYASNVCGADPQGLLPLGHVTIGLFSNGSWTLTAASPPGFITATSTESGDTSDFSQCQPISGATTQTPRPGQPDSASAPGFRDGEPVTVTLHSTPVQLTTVKASRSGVATATVTIPRSTPAGAHHLIFTGTKSGHVVSIPITVTPKPQAGLLRLLLPTTLVAEPVQHSTTIQVTGHAGIPVHGARHALVLAESTRRATVDGVAVDAHSSRLLVLPVTAAKITMTKPGKVRMIALGWYDAKKSRTGDVLRPVHPTTIHTSTTLTAGSHGLPFAPALRGIVLTVTSPQAGTTIGGVALPSSRIPTTFVARIVHGAVDVQLAKHATATITGWYGKPAAAPGGTITG